MFVVKHYCDEDLHLVSLDGNSFMGKSISTSAAEQPSCSYANNVKFAMMCSRMEILWKRRTGKFKRTRSQEEKVNGILPIEHLDIIKSNSQSVFPLLRLYCPDKDNARFYSVTEKAIAKAYCSVLGLETWGTLPNLEGWGVLAEMLLNFRDTKLVPSDLVGDLSLVVEHAMNERTKYTASTMTVKDINHLLDELAAINPKKYRKKKCQRKWDKENVRPKMNANLLEDWFRKVINGKRLSPLEHKWLIRIILKDTNFGVSSSNILRAYSPYANGLLAADGSLKSLCDKLAGPNFY